MKFPPVQLGLPHPVLLVGNRHADADPSHWPAQTSTPPQATRAGTPPVRGLPTTGMQVPGDPGSLQDIHCAAQSVLQQ
jgi:hypothetical protein